MSINVLMIGWELPPHNSGGLGTACYGLTHALSEKDVNLTFVLPYSANLNINFMNVVHASGTNVSKFNFSAYSTLRSYGFTKRTKNDTSNMDYVGRSLQYAQDLRKMLTDGDLRGINVDLIHTHDWLTLPAGTVAKSMLRKPLVAHVHATEYDRTGGIFPNEEVYEIEKEGFQKADHLVGVSKMTKNRIHSEYGIPENKISVVYNGIDEIDKQKLTPALSEMKEMGYKIVLFLGRITLQKGPEFFVRAAKKVLDFDKKVIFVVAGSGDMQGQMIEESLRYGIMGNMVYTGFLRGADVDRIYQTADLFVVPSVSEPFGITVLESVANGTPVLVSKQSGVSEVLRNVLKVDFWDVDEMANKILSVISYPAMSEVLKSYSKKELNNLTWSHSADSCMNVYNKLI